MSVTVRPSSILLRLSIRKAATRMIHDESLFFFPLRQCHNPLTYSCRFRANMQIHSPLLSTETHAIPCCLLASCLLTRDTICSQIEKCEGVGHGFSRFSPHKLVYFSSLFRAPLCHLTSTCPPRTWVVTSVDSFVFPSKTRRRSMNGLPTEVTGTPDDSGQHCRLPGLKTFIQHIVYYDVDVLVRAWQKQQQQQQDETWDALIIPFKACCSSSVSHPIMAVVWMITGVATWECLLWLLRDWS